MQLNALARSHPLSCITLFKEVVLYLFKLVGNKGSAVEDYAEMAHSGVGMENREVEVCTGSQIVSLQNVSRDVKNLNLTNLDDAEKRALLAAKYDFREARIKAIEPFSNEGLTIPDRIQEMTIRVAATMLEKIDHPKDALGVCISCLEALHSLPEVQRSFSLGLSNKFSFWKE